MNASDDLDLLRARIGSWLVRDALPLWLRAGFDEQLGLFHERLDFDGLPHAALPRRLMVQCRQLYVLAYATLRGLHDARPLIVRTWAQVQRLYRRPELPHRWAFSVAPDGQVHDARCDTYTLAFLLFALAWLYRVQPDDSLLRHVDEIYECLDGPLSAGDGAVIDGTPRPDAMLRQNPHMHLFEAYLALHEATRRASDLERANRIYALFHTRMLWREQKALPEAHQADWTPSPEATAWFEPGHHFEWVWLLRRYARISGAPVSAHVDLLLTRALAEGGVAEGAPLERIGICAAMECASSRCWNSCEYLKACAAEAEADPATEQAWRQRAAQALSALLDGFLHTRTPGLWRDRITQDRTSLSEDVPASTLYHLVLAISECDRVFGRVARPLPLVGPRKAFFFDRDGVINVDTGYPSRPEDIEFIRGAAHAITQARQAGYAVVVVTNQSGIARGYASEAQVMELHRWMSTQLESAGAVVDAWYHCPFHDEAREGAYRFANHPDRKPNPGMLQRAASDMGLDLAASVMIGDKPSDLEAAQRAGAHGHLFESADLSTFVAGVLVNVHQAAALPERPSRRYDKQD